MLFDAILKTDFFQPDTKRVARELIGKVLHHRKHGKLTSGIIIKTEVYLGVRDSACHAYWGRKTARVASVYRMGGLAYVYFIYGTHFCFNAVTRDEAFPDAVLIRALEPVNGIEEMRKRRDFTGAKAAVKKNRDLCSGPAKLCQAIGIGRSVGGMALSLARVGVDYALEPLHRPSKDWRLRFLRSPGIVTP